MALITFAEAQAHLRVECESDDVDLTAKIAEASDLVLDYLKISNGNSPGWTDQTTPRLVKAAVKIILHGLWYDRDGSSGGDYFEAGGPVARMLARYRDPALA